MILTSIAGPSIGETIDERLYSGFLQFVLHDAAAGDGSGQFVLPMMPQPAMGSGQFVVPMMPQPAMGLNSLCRR